MLKDSRALIAMRDGNWEIRSLLKKRKCKTGHSDSVIGLTFENDCCVVTEIRMSFNSGIYTRF